MKIYIENKEIEAKNGETIIETAQRNNISIPHFCWHPELSVGGNCRMCLVEVGMPKRDADGKFMKDSSGELVISYMPKLQIACNTQVSDEMRVNINTKKVVDARSAVMEFVLINHPLDCPICDEAGGCKLQCYSKLYSGNGSRFNEKKNNNLKRVHWNEKIIYDAERCISCGRCVRFMDEILNEEVLSFVNRGDKVRISRFQDKQIETDYSMNIIDNCPVGALTSCDFRFKSRVWEMSFNRSICTNCGRGCNINIGVKNNEVLRVQPVPNMYVNKYWMCDSGRLSLAEKINNKRLASPQIKTDIMKVVNWSDAIHHTFNLLKKNKSDEIFIICSANSSNETNYLLTKLAKQCIKTDNIGYISNIDTNFSDNMLKTKFKSPNTNGLTALGINSIDINKLISDINNDLIKTCIVIDEDFHNTPELISAFAKLQHLILCNSNHNSAIMYANAILPIATFAEYEGTFTNIDNRVQHFTPVIVASNNISPVDIINSGGINRSRLDIFGAQNDKWNQKPVMDFKPSWWIIKELLNHFGTTANYNSANEIFIEISNSNKLFAGMNYKSIDKHQGIVLGKSNSLDAVTNNYSNQFCK